MENFEIGINEGTEPSDILDHMTEVTDTYVERFCEQTTADDLGLDYRCGRLYVDTYKSYIIVHKDNEGSLQYYGGFEYVDSSCRTAVGNWVFYSSEDERVQGHLERLSNEEDPASEIPVGAVRYWLRTNHPDYETATELAEAAVRHFESESGEDLQHWLDDETHWIWERAAAYY